jgi:hypothetical protein
MKVSIDEHIIFKEGGFLIDLIYGIIVKNKNFL